jgi:hypothetical protein
MKSFRLSEYLAAWLVMLLVSVANGTLRDFTYGPHMTELAAHQLSTALGILLLGGIMWIVIRRHPPATGWSAALVGVLWAGLTVAFEFLFFHYAGRHSWAELLANYDVASGRVWVLVVLWLLVAPSLFFRIRGSA